MGYTSVSSIVKLWSSPSEEITFLFRAFKMMQTYCHTGSREDGLGSDGEEDESDDLDLYLGLNTDEVCIKNVDVYAIVTCF